MKTNGYIAKMNKLVVLVLLALVVVLLPLYASAAARVGGWTPISDVKDPHVVEIGEWAVSENVKRSSKLGPLKFERVVRGETQVVAGTNYRLTVEASGGADKNYVAVVWEKPWEKFKNLTSFEPLV